MTPSQYKDLEKDKKFKRYYLSKTLWWINYIFVPPSLVLFIGLAGVMHMGYNDKLYTWTALPYILVFVLGAIWLKAAKHNVQGKILDDDSKFLACAACSVFSAKGKYFFIFSTDSKRHNENRINKLAEELTEDSFSEEQKKEAEKSPVEISIPKDDSKIYLKAITINKVKRANIANLGTGITPLLYLSSKDIFVIRNKDLK